LKQYEETIVLDGSLENEQVDEYLQKIEEIMKSHGGTISDINRWGRRKLAYPIEKKDQGYYTVITFEAEGPAIAAIEQDFEMDETILRYLTIVVEKPADDQKEE